MNRFAQQVALSAAVAAIFTGNSFAAPVTGSAYYTDPQESHVFDQTSEAINTVNMITCVIDAMKPADMVNAGDYVALVGLKRCDSSNRSSASNSGSNSNGSSATQLARAIVNSSRTSTNSPMRVKAWIEEEEEGSSRDIYVNISASETPSSSNPYGEFRLDFCGVAPNQSGCVMQGFLSGTSTGLRFAENEQGGSRTRQVYLTKGATDSGAGAVQSVEPSGGGGGGGGGGTTTTTYQFAFDQQYFLRRNGGTDSCFDRALANSHASVWRYGLYDSNGNRVERQSGFPISFSSGGTTYQGYAGYWGVSLPPAAASALTTGSQVTRQVFGQAGGGTTYTVVKARGRLTKYTKQSATLASFTNVRFNFGPFNGLSNPTIAAIDNTKDGTTIRAVQLETYWDATAKQLKVSGYQNCGQNGCKVKSLASPVALTTTDLGLYSTNGIFGWSQSYGGPLGIPATTVTSMKDDATPTGSVHYRTQDLVYPGAAGAPTALYCVANCPTGTDIAAMVANTATEPWAAGTENAWGPTTSAPIAYTFNGSTGNLERSGTPAVVAANVTTDQITGQYMWGIRSGRMLAVSSDFDCGGGNYCAQNADEASVYYEWETGANSWNQFIGLQSGGQYLTFDAPMAVTFAVPNDSATYGEFAAATIVLQYAGFGELHGVPGHCVSPATNLAVSCDATNARYVPAFSIPESLTTGVVRDSSNNTYYVKWLDREVRFNKVANSFCSPLVAELGSLSNLPSLSNLNDPSNSTDSTYIGAKPTLTSAPRVLDGVVQRAAQ